MPEKALVSLTFDDGLRCQFEKALPILNRLKLHATFFLAANTEPFHMDGGSHPDWRKINWSAEDVQSLKGVAAQGHEIGAHSVTHCSPGLEQNAEFEAEESKRWISTQLEIDVPSYCYPFCLVTSKIKAAVVAAGYRQARGGCRAGYYSIGRDCDLFNLDCRLIVEHENVDSWVRPEGWHILMFHGIGTEQDGWAPISVQQFEKQMETLARLRDEGQVDVVTFAEGARRVRLAVL